MTLTLDEALESLRQRLDAHRSEPDEFGCQRWTGYRNPVAGYGQLSNPPTLIAAGWPRTCTAPWAACYLAHGAPEPDQMVLHRCDEAACCANDHVHWGTSADNNQDRVLMGNHNTTKLSPADVYAIRESRETDTVLAERYGLHRKSIYNVRHGITWGWLT